MSSVRSPRSGTQLARLTFKILPTGSYLLVIQDNFWFMWGLAQPWARPSVIASERWTHNVVRAKQKILSIHLHSSLQKQAPHYWPLVLFRLKTLILLLPPQSTSEVFCGSCIPGAAGLGKDHKQTQKLGSTVIKNNELVKYSIDKVCC